jgi:hypothetical protein
MGLCSTSSLRRTTLLIFPSWKWLPSGVPKPGTKVDIAGCRVDHIMPGQGDKALWQDLYSQRKRHDSQQLLKSIGNRNVSSAFSFFALHFAKQESLPHPMDIKCGALPHEVVHSLLANDSPDLF